MNKVSFLDCTLRDGGYINDWYFGNLTIRSIMSRLDAAGLDYIEVGFLDSRCAYNSDRSMFPDIPSISKSLGNIRPKHAKLVAMIDFGTFDENLLIPAEQSCLFGIRLIFTKERSTAALEYASKIKCAGYNLFLNLVSTSSYNDKELLELAEEINKIDPSGVSIVDTYGLMFKSDMARYALLLDCNLDKHISLGYHSHNNLQMSNANTIEFINLHLQRNIIIDSSILGMGKNAGNACTELMLGYSRDINMREFDIVQVLECAHTDISRFQGDVGWGYRLDFLISAILRCSPNWTRIYMKKNILSIKDICNILSELPDDKKYLPSFFSPELAEKLCNEYMNKEVNDKTAREELKKELAGRSILLVCPGASIKTHKNIIDRYISEKAPIIISINFIASDFETDFAFISNSLRYSQIAGSYDDIESKPKILITSNITPSPLLPSDFIFNFKSLHDEINGNVSAVLLLSLLLSIGIQEIIFAGLDGFDVGVQNYFDCGYMLTYDDLSNETIEFELKNVISKYNCSKIKFITPSKFEEMFSNEN